METETVTQGLGLLCVTAATIGFLHTLFGPDHYIPFVAMSRIGNWSLLRTVVITLLCGVGHVLSSVVLGLIGIIIGLAVLDLETFEAARGSLAAWLLLAFGVAFFVWGVHRAIRNQPHTHIHAHANGREHVHEHAHVDEHTHVHSQPAGKDSGRATMTPWILFTIFLFGPCEPLIPILMYPAAQASAWGVVLVTAIFALTTLATMTTIVVLARFGTFGVRLGRFERYDHAIAGLAVTACAVLMLIGF
ncbi:MAG: sulfite exporter TauE/SafE family protein [Planctomycetota bacterium]